MECFILFDCCSRTLRHSSWNIFPNFFFHFGESQNNGNVVFNLEWGIIPHIFWGFWAQNSYTVQQYRCCLPVCCCCCCMLWWWFLSFSPSFSTVYSLRHYEFTVTALSILFPSQIPHVQIIGIAFTIFFSFILCSFFIPNGHLLHSIYHNNWQLWCLLWSMFRFFLFFSFVFHRLFVFVRTIFSFTACSIQLMLSSIFDIWFALPSVCSSVYSVYSIYIYSLVVWLLHVVRKLFSSEMVCSHIDNRFFFSFRFVFSFPSSNNKLSLFSMSERFSIRAPTHTSYSFYHE